MEPPAHCLQSANGKPGISRVDGWIVHSYNTVASTNLVAAELPAWHAVRSDSQTAGRGRFQRSWVSDRGGLWLSAVIPAASPAQAHWLPLVIGLAVTQVIQDLGIPEVRMRWPNDILVNNRKLAGLLIDQFHSGLAVAGIGVNVSNHPETTDPSLAGQTSRLSDLSGRCPGLEELTSLVLSSVRRELERTARTGFADLLPRVNALWGEPRPVELDLDGIVRRGAFVGVDQDGRLLLSNLAGELTMYLPYQVRHLQEL